jgi:hypothetical protein
MTYISLKESAHLELQGAAQRLAIAKQALADFDAEHGNDYPASPELRESHERQRAVLETELDAARRQHGHSAEEYGRYKSSVASQ